jgi:hypothetical protein
MSNGFDNGHFDITAAHHRGAHRTAAERRTYEEGAHVVDAGSVLHRPARRLVAFDASCARKRSCRRSRRSIEMVIEAGKPSVDGPSLAGNLEERGQMHAIVTA